MKARLGFAVLVATCMNWMIAPQSEAADSDAVGVFTATDFSIPSSPAFVLLDVTPSKVAKPGFARDLKLDMLIKDNQILTDAAIEVQAVWMLGFKSVSRTDYTNMNQFLRSLGTLNISLGTAEKDSIRSLAIGSRINLYRGSDPLLDNDYVASIRPDFSKDEKTLELEIAGLETRVAEDSSLTAPEKQRLLAKIDTLERATAALRETQKRSVVDAEKKWNAAHWNDSMLDLGFGGIWDYESSALDSLSFMGKGAGIWLNGGIGLGASLFVSAIAKYKRVNGEDTSSGGGNIRYGSATANGFVEYVWEEYKKISKHTIGYGGDLKVGKTVVQFGLRTEYADDFKFRQLIPSVNFKMSGDSIPFL